MHAWAMPLGERGAQDLSITTFWSTPAPHFTMSTLLQTLDERMPTAGKIAKPLFFFLQTFRPPTNQTMAAFNPNLPGGA